jgi:Xaa-Pro aminopeptidase
MVKNGGGVAGTVFVPERDPAVEIWSGARLGTAGATQLTGLPARDARTLRAHVDSLASGALPFFVVGDLTGPRGDSLARTPDDQFVAALRRNHPQLQVSSAVRQVMQLRGRKSAAELALIRRSVEITVQAQREAMQVVRPGIPEYEVEAVIEAAFRRSGAERPSFATIIGSGPNATTLHYNANDRQMQAGEVVVMDVGSSYRGYAADVTRTVPVSGVYSPEQRAVYQIVRDAQAAAERQARPGAAERTLSDSAEAVVAAGLARLGLIESAAATYDVIVDNEVRATPQYRLYYMHGLGHGIGLEVHDPDQSYFTGTLAPGSAFTIEPGIYVRENVLEALANTPRNRALREKLRPVLARYANIGVRIEDDYIVTDGGLEWISRAPREIAEIEALMRERRPVP